MHRCARLPALGDLLPCERLAAPVAADEPIALIAMPKLEANGFLHLAVGIAPAAVLGSEWEPRPRGASNEKHARVRQDVEQASPVLVDNIENGPPSRSVILFVALLRGRAGGAMISRMHLPLILSPRRMGPPVLTADCEAELWMAQSRNSIDPQKNRWKFWQK
jgi:hypothetical protein